MILSVEAASVLIQGLSEGLNTSGKEFSPFQHFVEWMQILGCQTMVTSPLV
jgi:hypothetical protein